MDFPRPSRPRSRIGGLRGQLLIGLVVLLVVALALVAVATLQFHSRHLQQTAADEVSRHAGWLADIEDPAARQQAAQSLRERPEILHVGPPPGHLDIDFENPPRVGIDEFEDQSAVWAYRHDNPQSLVVLSLAEAQSAVDSGRRALVLYLGSTLLLVTLFGYGFLSFVVIRPLRALGVATERAARGDLASPVKVLPRNEFGEVGRQFNQMLATLESQREELEQQLEQLQQAHRELKETQESLIRSEKMASVGHLAAGIAHEVGNPLAAVMGYTDLLRDREMDREAADDLADRSIKQLKRIQRIIRQLLDYSRADSDTEPTDVDVRVAIDEAVQLVRATSEGGEVDFAVDIDDATDRAAAIAGELEQVLVNLLLNAVEAMHHADVSQQRVDIEARSEHDGVTIEIRDTGPGIDPEVADEIFDPFFTTRDPGEGTGLGLAIAQRLVDRVDGKLKLVDSEKGAHFRIRLNRWST